MARVELDPRHVANVVACIQQPTPEGIDAGKAWYAAYAAYAARTAQAHGLTADQGIALFAILSQRSKIDRNRHNFSVAVTTKGTAGMVCVCGPMKAKCLAALADSKNPGRYCTGQKISSFYANLQGKMHRVTVDRHAWSMVYGVMFTDSKTISAAQYTYCERVIRAAAELLAMTPADTQAVGWVVWRRLKGSKDGGGVAAIA